MKKAYLAILPLIFAAACTDDFKPNGGDSDDGGVKFSAKLERTPESRTIYQDRDGNAFPIFWAENDTVLLASPECGVKTATYVIEGTGSSTATSMTKVGEAGIQWGGAKSASFYSIYPKSYTMNGRLYTNTLTINNAGQAVAEINVRKYQMNRFEKNADGVWVGTAIDDDPTTTDICNYPDAIMYAQRYMSEVGTVEMQYHPFTTAFHIELDGYTWEWLSDAGTITIEDITIEAPEGTVICGKFNATFKDANTNEAPEVTVPTQSIPETNIIHVYPTVGDQGLLLSVAKEEKISFNVFAIPNPNVKSADGWQIRVKTTHGTYYRDLVSASTGDQTANPTLKAGMIHPVHFPTFNVKDKEFKLNVDSWMKNIPRNVYINELSIPGAWYSRQSEYQGTSTGINTSGTKLTVAQMWAAGVRAFSVETRSATSGLGEFTPSRVVVSGTGRNSAGYYYGGDPISGVINDIAAELMGKTYGYAVLALQYADGGDGGHRARDYNYWLQGIANVYSGLTDDVKGTIYQGDLTPSTTIGEVAGKLIILVNVAAGLPGYTTILNPTPESTQISLNGWTGTQAPAMYSFINKARPAGTSPVVEMHHIWSDDYMGKYAIENFNDQTNPDAIKNLVLSLNPNTLYLNYAIANRTYPTDADNVGVDGSGVLTQNGLPTYIGRKQAVKRMLRNSNIVKNEGRHNLMLFVGAGGNEATATDGSTSQSTALSFARVMNPWLLTQIYGEINNQTFSPFGMVFCNFISQTEMSLSGSYTYPAGSDKAGQTSTTFDNTEIMKGLVKMNRLFYLSRDPSKPETLSAQEASKASYSSTHNDGGDAWTIE